MKGRLKRRESLGNALESMIIISMVMSRTIQCFVAMLDEDDEMPKQRKKERDPYLNELFDVWEGSIEVIEMCLQWSIIESFE